MPSPYPITSLLGTLLFLIRHEPRATIHHAALLAALRTVRGGGTLKLQAEAEGLSVDGEIAPFDSPGTALVCEQMLLQGIRAIELPSELADADLLRLMSVLAAYPGTYSTFAHTLAALGDAASRISCTRVTGDYEVFHAMPWRPRSPMDGPKSVEGVPADVPDILKDDADEFQRNEEVSLNPSGEFAEHIPLLTGGSTAAPRVELDQLVIRGREAMGRSDWNGLLDVALEMMEAESEAATDLAGSSFRIELRRLLSRKHLVVIAEMAPTDRKQEAISVLRRFGAEASEILMALLVEGETIRERRAYYSAITQLGEGTEAVVYHLSHPQWYVVRNAADLCGELGITSAVSELVRQSRHEDERVRKSVVEALGRIGTPAAMEGLRKTLLDPVAAVRVKALAHLGGRQARGMTGAIKKLLEREEDEAVQQEALWALGRIATPEALTLLGEWAAPGGKLRDRKSLATRLAAIRGLSLAGPSALDILSLLQRDESPELKEAANRAIDALRP